MFPVSFPELSPVPLLRPVPIAFESGALAPLLEPMPVPALESVLIPALPPAELPVPAPPAANAAEESPTAIMAVIIDFKTRMQFPPFVRCNGNVHRRILFRALIQKKANQFRA
jgi:hypothetical protein